MMKRLLFLLFLLLPAAPVLAAGDVVRERILQELRNDGYTEVRVSRTFLGRARFIATKSDAYREIVVNPVTGLILRDYVRFLLNTDDGEGQNSGGSAEGSNYEGDDNGGHSSDDGDDDNSGHGSDDDDDDNIGHGSDDDDDDNIGHGSADDDDDEYDDSEDDEEEHDDSEDDEEEEDDNSGSGS